MLDRLDDRPWRPFMPRRLSNSDAEAWFSWLRERSGGADGGTGFDAGGWEDSTWVLHSVFEQPGGDGKLTHDDLHRAALRRGESPPRMAGSVNLHEVGTVIGTSLSMGTPRPGWLRLRWETLAERLKLDQRSNRFPPCYRWFPYSSRPATLHPPNEGTLDRTCLETLIDVLAARSHRGRETPCMAFFSAVAFPLGDSAMYEVTLGDIAKLVDPPSDRRSTPNNFWPLDKSWMVFTDCDLWGTKVSGPRSLIDALRASRDLECIDWTPPDDGSSG